MSSQCKKDMDCRTKLINNSNETLWYDFDCLFTDSLKWTDNCLYGIVPPKSSKEICSPDTWEERFSFYKTDKVKVFIVSDDTASTYNMFDIIKEKKYYRFDVYTLEELENLNWTITYP